MESSNEKMFAIVELFGHTQLAGEISTAPIGDFILVRIPRVGEIPGWSKMINPKAIYAITPCEESDAIAKATELKAMPIDRWSARQLVADHLEKLFEEGSIKKIEPASAEEE